MAAAEQAVTALDLAAADQAAAKVETSQVWQRALAHTDKEMQAAVA
jgi:hypothetical protein